LSGDRRTELQGVTLPHLAFASPRKLPRGASLPGRVVVLDIAFAASSGRSVSFDLVTRPFIEELGERLAAWVDHHDHERHSDYAGDPRFTLATKAEHGACPEMITPELVRQAGPIDTIVTHHDLDGLYSAAKWIRGGREPYPGADDDARAVDTRIGAPGPIGRHIDRALRARFRDDSLKRSVVLWLTGGMPSGALKQAIDEAAREFEERDQGTRQLAARFVVRENIAYLDTAGSRAPFDKTELLLQGQQLAEVSVVRDSGMVTFAARYGSGWDFVSIFQLEGGMPTRVTLPEARLEEALAAVRRAGRKIPPR
jgi:hypothetical protein